MIHRAATQNDLDCLLELRKEFLHELYGDNFAPLEEQLVKNNRTYFETKMADGSLIVLVVEEHGQMIATGNLSILEIPPNRSAPNGKVGYLSNIYVQPPYRGKKIGEKLLLDLMRKAKDLGIMKIQLDATQMGKHLYEKQGFEYLTNEMVFYWEKE